MKRLIVTDELGRELEYIEFSGECNISYTDHDGFLKNRNRIINGDFGKWRIANYLYYPVVKKLIGKFKELDHIDYGRILFLVDEYWEPGGAARNWIAKTSKANAQLKVAWGYNYTIEIRQYYTEKMDDAQVVALIYHELRHIGTAGDLRDHDVEDWDNMLATLGKDWAEENTSIPNILEDDFAYWSNLRKSGMQISFYDKLTPEKRGVV